MRRLLAAAALALLALPLAAPAASGHDDTTDHYIRWDRTDEMPTDGDDVEGTDFIYAFASFQDKVKSWDVILRSAAPGVEPRVCHQGDFPSPPRDVWIECQWDTTRAGRDGTGGLSVNGKYTIEVVITNVGGPVDLFGPPEQSEAHCLYQDESVHACGLPNAPRFREVYVVNPVSVPTGVGRSYDSGTRNVTVSWNPNPEPDIERYVIQEKVGDGTWTKVGERSPGSTTFERRIDQAGMYRYRVAAVRPEVSQSPWAETTALEVSPPEATPTATTGGEPAPEGDPGVPLPGTEDTTTTTAAPGTSPGTEQPRSSGGSSLFSRPSAGSFRSPPRPFVPATTPTTADTGYQETLPYKPQEAEAPSPEEEQELAGAEEPQVIEKIIEIPRPRNPRSLLVPLAGGLAMFVLAMQVTYMARRRPVAVPTVEEDFGDWLGL